MCCHNKILAMLLCALASGVLVGLIFPSILIVWLLAIIGILIGIIIIQN